MKIPKTIQIAGREIKIIHDSARCNEEAVNGSCYFDHGKIIMSKYICSEKAKVTLIHEVIHYINALLQRDNTPADTEEYVRPLSEFIYQFIKQVEGKS